MTDALLYYTISCLNEDVWKYYEVKDILLDVGAYNL